MELEATARKEEQFLNSLYCVTQRACQTLKKDKDLFSCSYYNRQEIENAVSIAKAIAERIITERGGAVAD